MFRDELIISQINEIKKSINLFNKDLQDYSQTNNFDLLTTNQLSFFSFISKQIIFLKNIYECESNYNLKVLISDYYNYIVSIIKNEHRYIYVNERSIIENYTRWIVSTDVDANHITAEVFEILKDNTSMTPDEYALIKAEYADACGYIHGSKILNDNLSYVFKECITNFVAFKNANSYYQKIIKMVKIFNRLIVLTYPNPIDRCFFRRKSVLIYLIGQDNVELLFTKRD